VPMIKQKIEEFYGSQGGAAAIAAEQLGMQ
jgi:hypothetical protein